MTTISGLGTGTTAGLLSGTSSSNSATNSVANSLTGAASGTSGSASTAVGNSASTALQQISDAIAALGAQAQGDVQEFEKTTQDVQYDNNATARQIGQLRLNSTRLNVISALSPNDNVDLFTFNVANDGTAKLGFLVNDPSAEDQTKDASGNIRVQIFQKDKGLVADSDASAGEYHDAFVALKGGTLDLSHGQYTVRISRADKVDPQAKNTYNYAMQLTQGTTYTQDFTVTEKAYRQGTDDPFGLANIANAPSTILSDSMSDAFTFINSLPPIGTPATSKLLGFINSTVV